MPTLHSISSGNFTAASTWGLVDTNLFLESRVGNTTVSTSFTASANFSPSTNRTIEGVSLQIAGRVQSSPTGTFIVELYNVTTASSMIQVTVNVSDIPSNYSTVISGNLGVGWMYFKFSSTQSLVTTSNYQIRLRTTSSSQLTVYTNGTANNWSRALVSTTTSTPGASDVLIIAGAWTAATAFSAYTVTMDSTSIATAYGTTYIGVDGKLSWPTTAGTQQLRLNSTLFVTRRGELEMGTVSNPIPSSSTAILEISAATSNTIYIQILGGKFTSYGQSTTVKAKLAADVAVSSTASTTNISTGWLSGDTLGVASTTRTNTQSEIITLNANAASTSLSHNAYVNAHGGNSTTLVQADIIKLNRNVIVRPTNSGATTSILVGGWQPQLSNFYTEFRNLGAGGTAGILMYSLTSGSGTTEIEFCSFYTPNSISGQVGITFGAQSSGTGTNPNSFDLSNNVFYGLSSEGMTFINFANFITNGNPTINDNVVMRCGSGGFNIATNGGSLSGNTFTSNTAFGLQLAYATGNAYTGTPNLNNINTYSNSNAGVTANFANTVNTISLNYTFNNLISWRNSRGYTPTSSVGANPNCSVIFDNAYFFGNLIGIDFNSTNSFRTIIRNSYFWAGTTLTTATFFQSNNQSPVGFDTCYILDSQLGKDYLNNISLPPTSVIGLDTTRYVNLIFHNCNFNGSTEASINTGFGGYTYMPVIMSFKHNNIHGSNKIWRNTGTILTDTTIFDTSSPSLKLSPVSSTFKLGSSYVRVPVNSGDTCTVSVRVRKSISTDPSGANYNGNQPRLIYLYNPIAGTTGDTVGATMTASTGTWQTLTYTTPSVSGDSVLEFYVDCDGTAGWVNVDNWSTTTSNDSRGTKYWAPYIGNYIEPDFSSSSGGGEKSFTFFG